MLDHYLFPLLELVRRPGMEPVPSSNLSLVQSLCAMLDACCVAAVEGDTLHATKQVCV